MSGAPSTAAALAGSLDWTGRSGRRALLLGALIFYTCVGLAPAVLVPSVVFPLVGILFPLYLGQLRRRIRDVGWRGGWVWVAQVPLLGVIVQIMLMFLRSTTGPTRTEPALLRRLGFGVALAVALIFVARGVFFAPFWIPAGSMTPALVPGDYIFVGTRFDTIVRGDVVVFRHPVNGSDFVKRVIGVAGDRVEMQDGRVILNGAALAYAPAPDFTEPFQRYRQGSFPRCINAPVPRGGTCIKKSSIETLPSGRSYPVLDIGQTAMDDTVLFRVPEGHVFVMGDNRDNSRDSRMAQAVGGIGFVPVNHIQGRVTWVALSLRGDMSRLFRRVP